MYFKLYKLIRYKDIAITDVTVTYFKIIFKVTFTKDVYMYLNIRFFSSVLKFRYKTFDNLLFNMIFSPKHFFQLWTVWFTPKEIFSAK